MEALSDDAAAEWDDAIEGSSTAVLPYESMEMLRRVDPIGCYKHSRRE